MNAVECRLAYAILPLPSIVLWKRQWESSTDIYIYIYIPGRHNMTFGPMDKEKDIKMGQIETCSNVVRHTE